MFKDCSSLKELNIDNFNTNKVNDMSYMFYNCSALKKLNLSSNFKYYNVPHRRGMFLECSDKLITSIVLKLDKFNLFNE